MERLEGEGDELSPWHSVQSRPFGSQGGRTAIELLIAAFARSTPAAKALATTAM
jgi:hypothetical protein